MRVQLKGLMKRRLTVRSTRSGSALVITVLIVSVISTISISMSALAISELRKTAIIQDSIGAFYAAESGIEQGLMQYRIWHDAEVSAGFVEKVKDGAIIEPTDNPTEKNGTAQIYNLESEPGIRFGFSDDGAKGRAWYGLKMWYKDDKIGNVKSGGTIPELGSESRRINRDSALNLTVEGATEGRIKWKAEGTGNLATPRHFMEIIVTNSATNSLERIPLDRFDEPREYNSFPLDGKSTVRIKAWDMQSASYSLLFLKDGRPITFDSQVSYVESSGAVGKAQRKLRVGINRASGTILESKDFLLYSGDGSIILQ